MEGKSSPRGDFFTTGPARSLEKGKGTTKEKSSVSDQRVKDTKRMHRLLNDPSRQEEGLAFAVAKSPRLSKAQVSLDRSLDNFLSHGDTTVSDLNKRETTYIAEENFDLAIIVKDGRVSREVAIAIIELNKDKWGELNIVLDANQALDLALAFPAHQNTENVATFKKRSSEDFTNLKRINGLDSGLTAKIKGILAGTLKTRRLVEDACVKKETWPKRKDGDIRRSFVDQKALLRVCLDINSDVRTIKNSPEKYLAELKEKEKIPETIGSLEELVQIIDQHPEIKGVSFDMYDTLVQYFTSSKERQATKEKRVVAYLSANGIKLTIEEFKAYYQKIFKEKHEAPTKGNNREMRAYDALLEMVQRILKDKKIPQNNKDAEQIAKGMEKVMLDVSYECATPIPEAITALQELKARGIKTVVTSNYIFDEGQVVKLLKRFGLMDYVDEVVVSSTVGVKKSGSDKTGAIFAHTLQKLGLPSSSVLHVGDNKRTDRLAPSHVGIKGIQYHQPENLHHRLRQLTSSDPDSSEYKDLSIKIQRELLDKTAKKYYDRNVKTEKPPEMEKYAMRLYEISRDFYGPVVIKFALHNLEKMLKDPANTINICMGRDALANFLVQRRLLQTLPEMFPGVRSDHIHYLPINRALATKAPREQLRKFLEPTGFFRPGAKVNLIDNGIKGTIQDSLTEHFPEVDCVGEYLLSRQYDDDPNRGKKHGFIVEIDSRKINHKRVDRGFRGALSPSQLKELASRDFVHDHEDLWNGIFESPSERLEVKDDGTVKPEKHREKLSFHLYDRNVLPGLETDEDYLLFKRMALKGVLDAIKLYRRETSLGIKTDKPSTILKLWEWYKNKEKHPLDRDLDRSLVRPIPAK